MKDKINTNVKNHSFIWNNKKNTTTPEYGPWKIKTDVNVEEMKFTNTTISNPTTVKDLYGLKIDDIKQKEIDYKQLEVLDKDVESVISKLETNKKELMENVEVKTYVDSLGVNRVEQKIDEETKKELENINNDLKTFKTYQYQIQQQLKYKRYDEIAKSEEFMEFVKTYDCKLQNDPNFDYELIDVPGLQGKDEIAILEYLMKTAEEGTTLEEFENHPDVKSGELKPALRYFKYMTTEQRAMYHYIYKTEGASKAKDYLYVIEDSINQAEGADMAYDFILNELSLTSDGKVKNSYNFNKEGLANVFDVSVEGLGDGITGFCEGIENAIYSDGTLSASDYKKAVILQYLNENSENLDFTYKMSSSIGNMIIPISASAATTYVAGPSAGKYVGNMLMGVSSFGNALNSTLANGYDLNSAITYSALNASSEVTLGYFLGNIPGLSAESAFTLRGMLQEGGEEYIQAWLDSGFRKGILGEEINLSEISAEASESFWMGVITSGIMNAPSGIINVKIDGVDSQINLNDVLKTMEDENLTAKEAMALQTNAEILDTEETVKLAIKLEDKAHGNGVGIEKLKAFSDPNSSKYQDYSEFRPWVQTILQQQNFETIQLAVGSFENINIDILKNDILAVIKNHDAKYGSGHALRQINLFLDKNSEYYGNYNVISSNGGARSIFSKYTIEEIQYGLNILSNNTNTVNLISNNFNFEMYNFFENSGDIYGCDQGIIEDLCDYYYDNKKWSYSQITKEINRLMGMGLPIPEIIKYGNDEYFALKHKLMLKGFSNSNASIILSSINDSGACSYATTCNEIFYQFRNNPNLFEKTFGYPMYVNKNGVKTLNSTELLLDLYLYANDVKNGGTFINGNQLQNLSTKVDVFGRQLLNSENQVYMDEINIGKKTEIINGFIKSKNPNFNYDANLIVNNSNGGYFSDEMFNQIINDYLIPEINNGSSVTMDIFYYPKYNDTVIHLNSLNPDKYSSISTDSWNEGGGHAVTITGITQDAFIVSSWGRKYSIPFNDLKNLGRFMINSSKIT